MTSLEDESMILLGDPCPEVIRLPADIPIDGGRALRVLKISIHDCIICGMLGCPSWILEDGYVAIECPACRYVFCRQSGRSTHRESDE